MSGNNKSTAEKPDMPKRVEALYRDASQNLVFLKTQQVTITNYALVAYAAVVTVRWHHGSEAMPFLFQFLLANAAIVGLAVSLYFLHELEGTMTKYRERLAWIYRAHFSCEEIDALKLPRTSGRPKGIFWGLAAISFIGFLIAIEAVLRS